MKTSKTSSDQLAVAIMIKAMSRMRKDGIDIGEPGSRKSLKVCNAIYLNAKRCIERGVS